MIRSCTLAVVLVVSACKSNDARPAPSPVPSRSSETAAKPQVAKPPPQPQPSALPTPPALPPATKAQPMGGFAGFSADGTSFAWVTPGLADTYFLKIIAAGKAEPEEEPVFEDAEAQKDLKAKLRSFSSERHAPPAELSLVGDLTTSPPSLALVRGGTSVPVPVGPDPYPPTDGAEIYGVSADGKHVAIHVGGKDVEGALSNGGGNDFHFFFVVTLP